MDSPAYLNQGEKEPNVFFPGPAGKYIQTRGGRYDQNLISRYDQNLYHDNNIYHDIVIFFF